MASSIWKWAYNLSKVIGALLNQLEAPFPRPRIGVLPLFVSPARYGCASPCVLASHGGEWRTLKPIRGGGEMTNSLRGALCWVRREFLSPTMPLLISISSSRRSNGDLSLLVRTIHLAAAARSRLTRLPLKVDTFVTRPNLSLIHRSRGLFFIFFLHPTHTPTRSISFLQCPEQVQDNLLMWKRFEEALQWSQTISRMNKYYIWKTQSIEKNKTQFQV